MDRCHDNQSHCWDGIQPGEHLVRMYSDNTRFLDSLEAFAVEGLKNGESVVVIATMSHLFELEQRLRAHDLPFAALQSRERYIRLNAHEALWQFLVDGHVDEQRFRAFAERVLAAAGKGGRRVRAFGEMVVLLWGKGNVEATMELERLWHVICAEKNLALYCAYPTDVFRPGSEDAIREIERSHSRVGNALTAHAALGVLRAIVHAAFTRAARPRRIVAAWVRAQQIQTRRRRQSRDTSAT